MTLRRRRRFTAFWSSLQVSRLQTARLVWLAGVVTVGACDCGVETHVEGAHPYERCTVMEPPEGPVWGGELAVSGVIDGHTLTIGGVDRVEAFAVSVGANDWLEATDAKAPLQIVLGGFGRSTREAEGLLGRIAARGPALLLSGGEDRGEVLSEALAQLEASARASLVDLRGIRELIIGPRRFMVLAGAPEGRYGLGDEACGFGPDDIALLAEDAQAGDHLLSWIAPRREGSDPLDRGVLGTHVGDPGLAAWMEENELIGGIYAWPFEAGGSTSGGDSPEWVVEGAGTLHLDALGSRVVGDSLVVRIDGEGLSSEPRTE